MRVELPYGFRTVKGNIRLSKSCQIIVPKSIDPLNHPNENITRAFGKSSVVRTAFSRRFEIGSVIIVVPRQEEFPGVIQALKAVWDSITTAGIRPSEILVLLADVTTKSFSDEYTLALFRDALPAETRIECHSWDDDSTTSYVGTTPSGGTPINTNSKYLQADLKIVIGNCLPDLVHSLTGAPYTIMPGISSSSTVCKTRMRMITESPSFLNTSSSIAADMIEGSLFQKPDVAMDFVTDYEGNISSFVVGELESVWEKSVKQSRMLMEVDCSLRADVAIVSMGGNPWDRTLYDALDGLFVATKVTREGGLVILVAECKSGLGPESFERLMRACSTTDAAKSEAQKHFMMGMEKVPSYLDIHATREITIVSELPDKIVQDVCHAKSVKSLQAALDYAEKIHGIDATYAIIPYGKFTSPINESNDL